MSKNQSMIGLHVASVLMSYFVLGLSYAMLPRTTNISSLAVAMMSAIVIMVATVFMTGILLMIRRSGKSESIALAVSTVAAFLLLVLAV